MFLLVPAYPGSPGQKAVKRLCVCVCVSIVSANKDYVAAFYVAVMRCWCGYLSGARSRLFACGPADATLQSQNPIISCIILIQNGFTYLVPPYPGCLGKEAVKRV